ncbi:MAG: hypothetical protein M1818_002772 [Claussenomyces sp. TS43310]|nr:MAG: hypothetical protein M1818_002772 [Claussenomyces sp. TS43310]
MASAIAVAKFLLPLLSICAIYSISSIMYHTGYISAFEALGVPGPHFLPGSTNLLERHYTGIRPLDAYLSNLQLVFANVVDGSTPELAVLGFLFAGTFFSIFMLLMIEGAKSGRRELIRVCLWGLGIQYAGYFLVMPWYCFTKLSHLSHRSMTNTSPKIRQEKVSSLITAMKVVPWSMAIGYVIPTILICIPGFSSPTHQHLIAFWQNFPLWVVLLQLSLETLVTSLHTISPLRQAQTVYIPSASCAYNLAFAASALTHTLTISIVTMACCFPHIFAPKTARALQPWNVLIPPRWDRKKQIGSMAEGAQNFLLWDYYVGTGAAMLWAVAVVWDSGKKGRDWRRNLKSKLVVWLAFGGLGGVIVSLMREREEPVMVVGESKLKEHPRLELE